MYKIMALIGEAGSGKDTLMKGVLKKNPGVHEIVSCTTRPPREGEVDGVNYFFMTPETFGDKVIHGEMLEASCFNDWFYGTGFESLRSSGINIGVFNLEGIESMLARKDVELIVFYARASDKQRLLRQLNREEDPDVHEILRRFKADWIDFSELGFEYEELENNTLQDLQKAIDYLSSLCAGGWPSPREDKIR